MLNTALDWPLSREEKKGQLLRLYSSDVEAADAMIGSGNKALEALRDELDTLRSAAGVRRRSRSSIDEVDSPCCHVTPDSTEDEVKRLHQAVENAAAVLRAILPLQEEDDLNTPPRCRARSEGATREEASNSCRPALRRTPRQGTPKRRVSFGPQPEEEPQEEQHPKLASCDTEQWCDMGEQIHSRGYDNDSSRHPYGYASFQNYAPGSYAANWPQHIPHSNPCDAYYHAPSSHIGFGVACAGQCGGFSGVSAHAPPQDTSHTWYPSVPNFSYPSQVQNWPAPQCQPYPFPGRPAPSQRAVDIFVEVSPEVKPSFHNMHNGTLEMLVPGAWIKLATTCSQDVGAFRPRDEFSLALPEVQRVVFDRRINMPPNGRAWCQARRVGVVLELPSHITVNAKLKTNSPFGSLVVEMRTPETRGCSTVLNYRLQVDGQLALYQNSGSNKANRVELELDFIFDCYVAGTPVAEPNQIHALAKTIEGVVCRDGSPPMGDHACMQKSTSEGYFK